MQKEFLVGYSGFVGSNLAFEHEFNGLFNSKNISSAYGEKPDILVYSGVRAEMFLANSNPQLDFEQIKEAISNIKKISPKTTVLISTVAVYDNTSADEDCIIDENKLSAYGKNRLFLEKWVSENCNDFLIVRLPALYGINLKKNFIYDYINRIPSMLSEKKFIELAEKEKILLNYYKVAENNFYKCISLTNKEKILLKSIFENLGFNSLNFTDSRSVYQFYNLKNLWQHIKTALDNNLKLINLVTPPISAGDLYLSLSSKSFVNELDKPPFNYNLKTKHFALYGGSNGYISTHEQVLYDIKSFVENMQRQQL